jgi:glycosyltransferase involved in cell wall biosynthesis
MNESVMLIGVQRGVHRYEALIQYSTDKFKKVYFIDDWLEHRFGSRIGSVIRNIYYIFVIVFMRPKFVIYLPMNNDFLTPYKFAHWLGITTVLDLYSLRSDIVGPDLQFGRQMNSKSRRSKYLKVDISKCNSSDVILVLTPREIDYVKKRCGVANAKFFTVPVVVQKLDFDYKPKKQSPIKEIVWWGQSSRLHGLDYIISEFRNLDKDKYRLTIFDNSKKRVADVIERLSIKEKNIYFVSDMEFYNEVFSWIEQRADVILGVFGDTDLAKLVVPNKVIESFQMTKPIISRTSPAYKDFDLDMVVTIDTDKGELSSAIKEVSCDVVDYRDHYDFFGYISFSFRLDKVFSECAKN